MLRLKFNARVAILSRVAFLPVNIQKKILSTINMRLDGVIGFEPKNTPTRLKIHSYNINACRHDVYAGV